MAVRLASFSAVAAAACLVACAPAPTRPALSTYACAQAVVAERLPEALAVTDDDALLHCAAAGMIARHCSAAEALLVAAGKELRDIVGPGNAEWRDWHADRRGIQCAKHAATDDALVECCRAN